MVGRFSWVVLVDELLVVFVFFVVLFFCYFCFCCFSSMDGCSKTKNGHHSLSLSTLSTPQAKKNIAWDEEGMPIYQEGAEQHASAAEVAAE